MIYQPNATLTFQIPATGAVVFDPDTGNPIEVTQSFTVTASLEYDNDVKTEARTGVDLSKVYLNGRAVEPRFLPLNLPYNSVASIEMQTGQNKAVRGRFYLLPTTKSRLSLESVFGDAIFGWMEVEDT